jgi:alkylation response protein AidB-like acyl-CoA dehydrogenase
VGHDDDLSQIRDAVRELAGRYGPTYFAEHARARQPLVDLWDELAKHGFIGINVPEEFGGGGAGIQELAVVAEAAASVGAPLLLLMVSAAISGELLTRFGSPRQQADWLPRLASGETKMVFAITEPDAGTNSHRLATTATRDGGDYVLRGSKHYITGVNEAEAVLVVARTGTHEHHGRPRLALFIVDTDSPRLGRTLIGIDAMLPETQYELSFDDVRVSAESLLGEQEGDLTQVFHGLNPERIVAAATGVGVGRHVLERAADYARTRRVWAEPIGTHQGVAHPLAKAKVNIELAALMTSEAARLHSERRPAGEASNMAKYAAAEAALASVDAAIQTHGGHGLSSAFGLLPYWALARLLQIAPINREMILNYVGEHSLRLPRSY